MLSAMKSPPEPSQCWALNLQSSEWQKPPFFIERRFVTVLGNGWAQLAFTEALCSLLPAWCAEKAREEHSLQSQAKPRFWCWSRELQQTLSYSTVKCHQLSQFLHGIAGSDSGGNHLGFKFRLLNLLAVWLWASGSTNVSSTTKMGEQSASLRWLLRIKWSNMGEAHRIVLTEE